MADDELKGQLAGLNAVLNRRAQAHKTLVQYDEGGAPIPNAVVQGRLTRAYKALMPAAEAPWGSLVVDSVQDRMEVDGIRSPDERADKAVWGLWQDNAMDAESTLAHRSVLLDGRAFALVWPDDVTGEPEISLDDSTQMAVQYESGSRRKRVAAVRRWVENDRVYATLYKPDGIYKFQANNTNGEVPDTAQGWERRKGEEEWTLSNPTGEVPVVELAVNRRLKAGSYGYARGEFEHCIGLIDRINLLTFLGLVVGVWMGFPLRGVIGDKIIRDDDGNQLPPFESRPDSVVQFENPDAKLVEFKAADRKNLSVFAELDQLAVITKTPRHYFPLEQGMSNLSAEAIMASEGGLHSKVTGHKASLSEGWEEVLRLGGRMLPEPVELSPRAELGWKDHQSRSLAERADAGLKLNQMGLPWQVVAETALNASASEIERWASLRTSDAFGQLLSAATATPTVPATNGQPSALPVS